MLPEALTRAAPPAPLVFPAPPVTLTSAAALMAVTVKFLTAILPSPPAVPVAPVVPAMTASKAPPFPPGAVPWLASVPLTESPAAPLEKARSPLALIWEAFTVALPPAPPSPPVPAAVSLVPGAPPEPPWPAATYAFSLMVRTNPSPLYTKALPFPPFPADPVLRGSSDPLPPVPPSPPALANLP